MCHFKMNFLFKYVYQHMDNIWKYLKTRENNVGILSEMHV